MTTKHSVDEHLEYVLSRDCNMDDYEPSHSPSQEELDMMYENWVRMRKLLDRQQYIESGNYDKKLIKNIKGIDHEQ